LSSTKPGHFLHLINASQKQHFADITQVVDDVYAYHFSCQTQIKLISCWYLLLWRRHGCRPLDCGI